VRDICHESLPVNREMSIFERLSLGTCAENSCTIIKGNWLDWYKAEEGHWPLTPVEYDVKLMPDDGFTELAATKLTVAP